MDESVWASIITYNPEIGRLRENINAIIDQVDGIVIVDNGSKNVKEINDAFNGEKIHYVINEKNLGIAAALNQAMTYAKGSGATWVITLDDDSVCPSNIISAAGPLLGRDDIGEIIPLMYESVSGEVGTLGDPVKNQKFQEVGRSITAGSITNISIWEKVGKFDEDLFIDYVDFDFSEKVRINGYKIIRMNDVRLDQHVGNSEVHHILFYKVRVGSHSSFRKYYIGRNMIIFIRRYGKYIDTKKEWLRVFKVWLLIVLFEKDKREKLTAFNKGMRDGFRYTNI